jgi:RES domain-containing protein
MVSRSEAPLRAFRIADGRHPLFDGTGAMIHGGRWNPPGRPVIYAALTYAGALLEILARVGRARLPPAMRWIEIGSTRPVAVEEVEAGDVAGWPAADMAASRRYGARWLDEARSVALIVPSVVATPHERNVVINPLHGDFRFLRATRPRKVAWDARLFRP